MAISSGVDITAVRGRAGGCAGVAISSDVEVVSSAAIIIEVASVGGASVQQSHGSSGYSRQGSVAGVDTFGVFCCWWEGGSIPDFC